MPEKEGGRRDWVWGEDGVDVEGEQGRGVGKGFRKEGEGEWEVVQFEKTPLVSE